MFIGRSTLYTGTTGADLLAELDAARAIPTNPVRVATHSVLRVALVEQNLVALRQMGDLDGFIREGFEANVVESMREMAGLNLYTEAYNENWASTKQMLLSAKSFIANNTLGLTAGGMVVGFAADFELMRAEFDLRLSAFLQQEEATKVLTDAKITGFNVLYDKLMDLGSDGQRYFWNNAAIREEFVYEVVLRLITDTTAKHGVGGLVLTKEDDAPLVNAEMTLEELMPDGTVVLIDQKKTDIDGLYSFVLVKDGRYRVTATHVERVTERQDVLVDGGPVTVDFKLRLV